MCAHVAMLVRAPPPPPPSFLLILILLISFSFTVHALPVVSESQALLKFKESLINSTALANWQPSVPPCSGWLGVRCLGDRVWGLQLQGMGLRGYIDLDALVPMPTLRAISLMNNDFQGPIPRINTLGPLKSVYLSNNKFSGEIPDDAFTGMGSLKKVHLANNEFTGRIPSSLANLPRLLELRLEGNHFQGQIPNFPQKALRFVNVSDNQLDGPIPHTLSKMDLTSFSGNENLCGEPLGPCGSPKRPSIWKVAIGVFMAGLAIGAIIVIAILVIHRRRSRQTSMTSGARAREDNDLNSSSSSFTEQTKSGPTYKSKNQGTAGAGASSTGRTARKAEQKLQLSFVSDDRERFDLQDLLRASAEVLGSGNFGSSYKATIMNGQCLVVKRYKQMTGIGREDFNEHMRRLGKLKHQNLLPLVAYYYRKEEKLLVYDFVLNGSLATHLHGNQAAGLDWKTRLNIIKGVCRGLAYLYSEFPNLVIPHGHLKSSNVLLDESFKPLLTDYALAPVTNPEHARQLMVAYRSPECIQQHHGHGHGHGHSHARASKKSDIWSLGTLILETLTGKFPVNYISQDDDGDLATWVVSTVNEGRTSEVFDKEMGGTKDCKGEMIKLLKIGLSCCENDVERRLSIAQVGEKVEELREMDHDNIDIDHDQEAQVYSSSRPG